MKRYFIPTIILASLLLTACGGLSTASAATSISEGLKISFSGETLFTGGEENQEIVVDVENKGQHPIRGNQIQATLKGIDPADFGLTTASLTKTLGSTTLEGIELLQGEVIPGGEESFIWQITPTDRERALAIEVDICYNYQTESTTDYCVRENNNEESQICQPTGNKKHANIRAPIKITQSTQTINTNTKSELILTFTNTADGTPYTPNTNFCTKNNKNKIEVHIDPNKEFCGNTNCIKCTDLKRTPTTNHNAAKAGILEFPSDSKKTQITCKITNPIQENTQEKITILTKYQYKQKTTTQIKITPTDNAQTELPEQPNRPAPTPPARTGTADTTTGGNRDQATTTGTTTTPLQQCLNRINVEDQIIEVQTGETLTCATYDTVMSPGVVAEIRNEATQAPQPPLCGKVCSNNQSHSKLCETGIGCVTISCDPTNRSIEIVTKPGGTERKDCPSGQMCTDDTIGCVPQESG